MGTRTDVAAGLTERQRDVLKLVARGKTNFEIAQELGITLDGAKWHLREIMAKLGCDTREEAVAVWKSRRSVGARVTRALGWTSGAVGSPLARIAVASGIVTVVVIAALAVAMANRSDDGGQARQTRQRRHRRPRP